MAQSDAEALGKFGCIAIVVIVAIIAIGLLLALFASNPLAFFVVVGVLALVGYGIVRAFRASEDNFKALSLARSVETKEQVARDSRIAYGIDWGEFEQRALAENDNGGTPGWAWAEDKVAEMLQAIPNQTKTRDSGIDARYYGSPAMGRVSLTLVPIQVKMQRGSIGRPAIDRLLGVQASLQNQGQHVPMAIMVTLYPSSKALWEYAQQQGQVSLSFGTAGVSQYPKLQLISVFEMLQEGKRPLLPPKA